MTEELHNLTIVDQATHKCTYVRTICDDVTAAELLDAYIRRIGRPGGTRGKLVRKQTDIELESDRTLKSIGITDGETLIAYIDMTPGGFMPVASWEALQLTQDILSQLLPDMLYALLLYTDQDKDLVTYVRKNVTELHHMSGNQCTLYVLEKPAKAGDRNSIDKYWRDVVGDEFDILQGVMTQLRIPLQRSEAYGVGRHLGVKPEEFPCIVFFETLDPKRRVTCRIRRSDVTCDRESPNALTIFFRSVFSSAQEAIAQPPGRRLRVLEKSLEGVFRGKSKFSNPDSWVKIIASTEPVVKVLVRIAEGFLQ